jgi:hypothetical protein
MADSNSRYADLAQLTYITPQGVEVVYSARRFLPPAWRVRAQGTTAVASGEQGRLDLVAWRTLRDPLLFWQIADANNAMSPFALVAEVGTTLRVPAPQPAGGGS